MTRIHRIIAILLHIQQKRQVTSAELAEHFEVSQRTIYRDMQILHEAGLPLQATAGQGYRLGNQEQLAPISFSREQAFALFTARTLAGHKTNDATLRQLDDALEKIKSAANSQDHKLLDALVTKSWSMDQLPPEKRHHAFRFLADIQLALAAKNLLDIEYIAVNGQPAWRTIEPHGLFFNQQWHLLAWCRLRQDLRDFRIDRIRQLRVGTPFITRSNLPDLATYFQSQHELDPPQKYTLQFAPDVAAKIVETKYYYGWLAEKTLENGWIEMEFSNNSVEYMGRWCMYWLPYAKAVSPHELQAFIKKQISSFKS